MCVGFRNIEQILSLCQNLFAMVAIIFSFFDNITNTTEAIKAMIVITINVVTDVSGFTKNIITAIKIESMAIKIKANVIYIYCVACVK